MEKPTGVTRSAFSYSMVGKSVLKMKSLLLLIALLTLAENTVGQQYNAIQDSTGAEEVVPDPIVQKFLRLTSANGDSISNDIFWFTGITDRQRYYVVTFDNYYIQFEQSKLSQDFIVTELKMPVSPDTLPSKIRRVIDGKIKRHCRKYAKEIISTDATYFMPNGKLYSVRCEVYLGFKGEYPGPFDYTDFRITSFTVRNDGSIRKHFPRRR